MDTNFNNDFNNDFNNEFNTEVNNIKYYIKYFFIAWLWIHISMLFKFFYYHDTNFNFYIFFKRLEEELLKYNGIYDNNSQEVDCLSLDAILGVVSVSFPEIKYEDKYLDDIKKMCLDYKFNWTELEVKDNKFNQLYEAHKINLVNEKYKLNQSIVEKSMEYLGIDDDVMTCDGMTCDFFDIKKDSLEKESRKKVMEDEISMMRTKIKELEEISEVETNSKLKMEARDFVIKERLDALKNNFIIEKTPLGNVIMYWNNSRESFEYYSDNTIPYRYLETVGRKYVKTFNCRQIYVDMEFELSEFERKEKVLEKEKELEDKKKIGLIEKKDVFAKFKNYNKESGTGKVNRGVAPPKNSIPNNNNMKKPGEKVVLKENTNRYTCEGPLANFSILKKPDRKVIDKKYAMTFADYKSIQLKKVNN